MEDYITQAAGATVACPSTKFSTSNLNEMRVYVENSVGSYAGGTFTIQFYKLAFDGSYRVVGSALTAVVPAGSTTGIGFVKVEDPNEYMALATHYVISGNLIAALGSTARLYVSKRSEKEDVTIDGYDAVNDVLKVSVTNIDGSAADVLPLIPVVNETNAAAATTYWPAAGGIPMKVGNKSLTLWDNSVGGVTLTLQIAPTSAFTTPVAIAGTNMTDGTTTGSDWVDSNGKAISYENIGMCYYRLKVVTSDTSNTVLAYINQW
jgi:hypothetical protein